MRNWPNWIPSPNAWMSAVLLVILMRGLALVVNAIVRLGDFLLVLPPKWRGILYIAALISPILLIAITHHLLHLILDRLLAADLVVQVKVNPIAHLPLNQVRSSPFI